MRPEMPDILRCPMCGGRLALAVEKEQDGEIIAGTLRCAACDRTYPIEDAIPTLLPPPSPGAEA